MSAYLVRWEITLDADSPEEAAKIARGYQRDESAEVGYFEVFDTDGREHQVDLDRL